MLNLVVATTRMVETHVSIGYMYQKKIYYNILLNIIV